MSPVLAGNYIHKNSAGSDPDVLPYQKIGEKKLLRYLNQKTKMQPANYWKLPIHAEG